MRASQMVGPGRIECVEVPVPHLGDTPGVLVRTRRASICGSDVHTVAGLWAGGYPGPPGCPGHEAVGEVVDSTVQGFRPGQQVLTVPEPACAGAFAELQLVPPWFLLPLPDTAGPDLVLAQQLGTVIYALKRFWPAVSDGSTPPDRSPATGAPAAGGPVAAVLGCGSAGLFFVHQLKRRGFRRVLAADLDSARLAAARRLGADVTVPARQASAVEAVMDETRGRGADLVIEAAGHDVTRSQAFEAVAVEGRIGLFGLPEHFGASTWPFWTVFRRRPTIEITWDAQNEPGLTSFREAVDLLHGGGLDPSWILSHRFGIEDIGRAVDLATTHPDGTLKIAIDFPEEVT